jgi:hypothetical protein
MFKTLALLPAIFAGANAIKAQYHTTTDPVEAASEPDPEIAARFQDPVVDKDDMLWRLDYTQTVFEAFNSFVDTIALFDNDAEGWGWYVNQNAGWYIEEINWCTMSLADGF